MSGEQAPLRLHAVRALESERVRSIIHVSVVFAGGLRAESHRSRSVFSLEACARSSVVQALQSMVTVFEFGVSLGLLHVHQGWVRAVVVGSSILLAVRGSEHVVRLLVVLHLNRWRHLPEERHVERIQRAGSVVHGVVLVHVAFSSILRVEASEVGVVHRRSVAGRARALLLSTVFVVGAASLILLS